MKPKKLAAIAAFSFALISPVKAQATGVPGVVIGQVLTGDTRLACEAILCLATGVQPAACTPSINRLYSIVLRNWSRTLSARKAFLGLCPTGSNDPLLASLRDNIAANAQRCSPSQLNMAGGAERRTQDEDGLYQPGRGVSEYIPIPREMPFQCEAYFNHPYTHNLRPVYIGQPEYGGYWTTPDKAAQAQADFDRRLAERLAEEQQWNRYN
jgi:hypothetical protein